MRQDLNCEEGVWGCVHAVCFPFNILSIGLIGYNTHYAAAAASGNVYQQSLQFCKFSLTFAPGSVFCLCSFGLSVLMNEDKVFRSTSQYVFC